MAVGEFRKVTNYSTDEQQVTDDKHNIFRFHELYYLHSILIYHKTHSHDPRRSSRKLTCSLRESILSSCRSECDRKLVWSERNSVLSNRKSFRLATSSSGGKRVDNGARTISNFYKERNRRIFFKLLLSFNVRKIYL